VGRRISSNDCSDYSGKVSEESTIYSIPAEVHCYRAITSHLRQVSNMEHRYCAGFYVLGKGPLLAYSVEKLQIFPGGKFICDITNYKI
jgi:hypothetical protein